MLRDNLQSPPQKHKSAGVGKIWCRQQDLKGQPKACQLPASGMRKLERGEKRRYCYFLSQSLSREGTLGAVRLHNQSVCTITLTVPYLGVTCNSAVSVSPAQRIIKVPVLLSSLSQNGPTSTISRSLKQTYRSQQCTASHAGFPTYLRGSAGKSDQKIKRKKENFTWLLPA